MSRTRGGEVRRGEDVEDWGGGERMSRARGKVRREEDVQG